MKANDLGKLGSVKRTRRSSASKGDVSTVDAVGIGGQGYTVKRESKVEDDDEPWLKRLSKKPKAAKLITLSDDED